MSFFPAPYIGRFHHGGAPRHWGPPSTPLGGAINDVAPFFRMFDAAIDNLVSPATAPWARRQGSEADGARTFQPRFDVKESEEAYELRGELPGVEANDLEVKFADEQTLVIKGKTETEKSAGTPPTAAVEGNDNKPKTVASDAANENDTSRRSSSASYVKPTVEDEVDAENPTPSTSTAAPEQSKEAAEQQEQQQDAQNPSRYWYSERSTGTFQRTFNFPSHVDQDGVVANLKNGVLDVVVPKRKVEEGRKINVGTGA